MSRIQGKIHTFYECAKTHSYENQPLMVSQRVPLSGLVITSPTRCWFRPSWGCKQRGKYYALLKSEMKNENIKKKSDLKGPLHPVLRHLRLGLHGCRHFLWQVAQHKERLVCRNANKLARVGPKDLRAQRGQKKGTFTTHATCDGGLRRRGGGDGRVWAGCRCGGSVLCTPSRRRPDHSGISPPVRSRQRYLTASGSVNVSLSTRKKQQKGQNSK